MRNTTTDFSPDSCSIRVFFYTPWVENSILEYTESGSCRHLRPAHEVLRTWNEWKIRVCLTIISCWKIIDHLQHEYSCSIRPAFGIPAFDHSFVTSIHSDCLDAARRFSPLSISFRNSSYDTINRNLLYQLLARHQTNSYRHNRFSKQETLRRLSKDLTTTIRYYF